jgi:hypothetical protein
MFAPWGAAAVTATCTRGPSTETSSVARAPSPARSKVALCAVVEVTVAEVAACQGPSPSS